MRPAIFQAEEHKVDRAVFLDAIRDAFVIGALAGDATIVNRIDAISKKSERNANPRTARDAKTKKKDRGLIAVKAEIEAVKADRSFAVSTEFALFIRPGVLHRLEVSEDKDKSDTVWPKIGTIKSWLKNIKEGKTDSVALM
jgi:hypothetical protein